MHTFRLMASDYQKLLDEGWRRCGEYSYCPINEITCCPNYSISCHATEFKITRSQRKCIEKVNNFLIYGDANKKFEFIHNYKTSANQDDEHESFKKKTLKELRASRKARDRRFLHSCQRKVKLNPKLTLYQAMKSIRKKWLERIRMQKSNLTLEDYLFPRRSQVELPEDFKSPKHKLVLKMRHVNSTESKALRNEEHTIMVEYQKTIHKERLREWTMARFCDFLVVSPIITERLRNFKFIKKSGDTDDDTYSKYTCDTPSDDFIVLVPPDSPTAYGTFHCTYHLDGELIAAGVMDVLPKCFTTVYFFYNPKYKFLKLGIYSALIEISMIRQIHRHFSGKPSDNKLVHYYMGYYVHGCKKMIYKTTFKPSYMLCPRYHQYVETEICLKKHEGKKYTHFYDDQNLTTLNLSRRRSITSIDRLLIIPISSPVTPRDTRLICYLRWLSSETADGSVDLFIDRYLMTYARLIGGSLLSKLCLQIDKVHRSIVDRHRTVYGIPDITR